MNLIKSSVDDVKLKDYPHFDAPIPRKKIKKLLEDFISGKYRAFYPFIRYELSWKPFRLKGNGVIKPKCREIRYGSRRDAYVFSYYRKILSELYEKRLIELDIADCPIAYRRLAKTGGSGKSNIDFAKDAFDKIDSLGNCVAIALDISKYFESLDHSRIKQVWCELLGKSRLPNDHFAVFNNITQYRWVDQTEMYKRLGFIGHIRCKKGQRYLKNKKEIQNTYKKLCSRKDFEDKICGKDPNVGVSLVKVNPNTYGIPQGAPISDLIANFYLMDFDMEMKKYVQGKGGKYMRYSDDILLILPGEINIAMEAIDFVCEEVSKQGPEIKIKNEKTCVALFRQDRDRLLFEHIHLQQDEPRKNGFEYLGFRYDGQKVYVRDSTVSRFFSKVAKAAYFEARWIIEKYPDLKYADLINKFNFSHFSERFFRVKKYNPTEYSSWTFYSYIKKSSEIFGRKGNRIPTQFKGFENFSRNRVNKAIKKLVLKRAKKKIGHYTIVD